MSVSGDVAASTVGGGAERCPRCGSHDTKFCYYNNYNLAQPRHFCKACRRYWTLGGSLRDVPVGGSTRSSAHRSKQQNPGRPGSSAAAPSPGRRLLPAQAPAPTTYSCLSSSSSSSPAVSSLGSGAPSAVPIFDVVPYTVSGDVDEVGVFTQLLTEPPPAGFIAHRDPFLHGFDDFSLELGLSGTADQLIFGMETGTVGSRPFFGEDGGAGLAAGASGGGVAREVHLGGEAWRVVAGEAKLARGDGDGWSGWPELAIPATPGERSGLQ